MNEISEWYHVLYILINIYFVFEYFGNVQKDGWKVYDRKPAIRQFVTSVFWKLTNEISEWYHVLYILINIYFVFEYFRNV